MYQMLPVEEKQMIDAVREVEAKYGFEPGEFRFFGGRLEYAIRCRTLHGYPRGIPSIRFSVSERRIILPNPELRVKNDAGASLRFKDVADDLIKALRSRLNGASVEFERKELHRGLYSGR
jgi:hypothetical protein